MKTAARVTDSTLTDTMTMFYNISITQVYHIINWRFESLAAEECITSHRRKQLPSSDIITILSY